MNAPVVIEVDAVKGIPAVVCLNVISAPVFVATTVVALAPTAEFISAVNWAAITETDSVIEFV